jgi:hypothetical protein
MILEGFHHIGVLLVLPYHIYIDPLIASRTSNVFGWLWLAHHGFSFIERNMFPLLGMETGEGRKTPALKRMRERYATITVTFIYSYYFAEGQPGIGLNYQTIALTNMIFSGRFTLCHRYVDWMRYIEVPGAIFVYTSALCGYNLYWGMVSTVCAYTCALTWMYGR